MPTFSYIYIYIYILFGGGSSPKKNTEKLMNPAKLTSSLRPKQSIEMIREEKKARESRGRQRERERESQSVE
jgi:hypothetical protein